MSDEKPKQLTPKEFAARYAKKPLPDPASGLIKGTIDPKDAVKIVARRMTSLAMHTLANICEHSPNDTARVSAAKEILDRAWGKAHAVPPDGEAKPGAEIKVVFGDKPTVKVIENAKRKNAAPSDESGEAEEQLEC